MQTCRAVPRKQCTVNNAQMIVCNTPCETQGLGDAHPLKISTMSTLSRRCWHLNKGTPTYIFARSTRCWHRRFHGDIPKNPAWISLLYPLVAGHSPPLSTRIRDIQLVKFHCWPQLQRRSGTGHSTATTMATCFYLLWRWNKKSIYDLWIMASHLPGWFYQCKMTCFTSWRTPNCTVVCVCVCVYIISHQLLMPKAAVKIQATSTWKDSEQQIESSRDGERHHQKHPFFAECAVHIWVHNNCIFAVGYDILTRLYASFKLLQWSNDWLCDPQRPLFEQRNKQLHLV